jgi:hypothetical protein
MKASERTTMALAVLALLAACGTDHTDLGGTYRVDSDVGSAPCGADQPLADAPAFLIFKKGDLFGATYYAYDGCSDVEGTMCPITGSVFDAFAEPIDNGWRGRVSNASTSAGMCLLAFLDRTAVLRGNQLAIESNSYRDMVMLPDAMCQPSEAETRGASMPCVEHEHISATKL